MTRFAQAPNRRPTTTRAVPWRAGPARQRFAKAGITFVEGDRAADPWTVGAYLYWPDTGRWRHATDEDGPAGYEAQTLVGAILRAKVTG
jgi:hypothetical protein